MNLSLTGGGGGGISGVSKSVNVSSYNSDHDSVRERYMTDYLLIFFFCVVILTTVVGNTLIILAVFTTRRLRTVTNCFVTSLAVADWLVGTFVMPIAVVHHFMGTWELGRLICDIWVSLDVCLCTASILSLCAISIDRYLAITKPLRYTKQRRSKRLASLMILVVWILSLVIACAPIFGWYDENRHKNKKCGYNQNKGYVVFSAMGSFFVPLVVVVYVYFKISCVIAQRHQNLEALNGPKLKISRYSHDSIDRAAVDMDEVVRISLRRGDDCRVSLKRENKTAQTLSIVVGGFIACWLFFFIVYLINPFLPEGTVSPAIMTWLTWLGWMNSAINPFIYAFVSPDFRMAFWRLTCSHCMDSRDSNNVNGLHNNRSARYGGGRRSRNHV
ncbi:octopamine receptor 1-like [Adelges cooleyi]|uniref:octopamine receptor 1-like n=1 Tax=Adelges cooleyi TaxID=133065 RepID=UPI00217FFB9B|nr:octopamine receptor 1-like [Adelges cooleyi]XP_050436087.1 octopamine receptor 1-like [Adelges cooleyi]XP_050436088.1 octopamine receptor 1-like [Adelges cooleyi]XP_050436089.1 octopamine receptor 1-like [Adelges cooleyi]